MKISIVVPYHQIPETAYFISRLTKSLSEQSHKDYELILLQKGRMGETYNEGIKQAKGDVIKLMGMDDYFAHKDALKEISDIFREEKVYWVASSCEHDVAGKIGHKHTPQWNDKLFEGYNTVGGFATISIRNKDIPKINEGLDWCVDIDWYWRIMLQHGRPHLIEKTNVIIGVGPHQVTSKLSKEQKEREYKYTKENYGN